MACQGAQLPGFTRGLEFHGPLAFVGLPRMRDSEAGSGIALAKGIEELVCGVWVVNIKTGRVGVYPRFDEGLEEILAVRVMHNTRYPEILDLNDRRLSSTYLLPPRPSAEAERDAERAEA